MAWEVTMVEMATLLTVLVAAAAMVTAATELTVGMASIVMALVAMEGLGVLVATAQGPMAKTV